MQTAPDTAEQVHGRARGALFFAGFGAVWLLLGLEQTGHASVRALLVLAVFCGCLAVWAVRLLRHARELPPAHLPYEVQERARRMLVAVNIIQWVSVGTAILILSLLHMPEYVAPAIAVIVGLHLVPLAESFRNPQHYVTAVLLLGWAGGCLLFAPALRVSGVTSVGVGVVLLGSALAMLLRMRGLLRVGVSARRVAA